MTRPTRWIGRSVALAIGLALVALLAARVLQSREAAGAAAAPGGGAAAAAPQALELSASDIATARRGELVAWLAVSGGLKAADSALVKAKVAAELRELRVREGERVAAGQVIGRLDDTEFRWRLRQAEDQAAAAQAQLEIAERTLANNRALVDQGFISRNALETSLSSANGARASLQAARAAAEIARKSLADTEVRAPIAGLVAQRFAQPGERVAPDARIVEIVDLSRLELEAAVTAEDVVALRVGQPARVRVDGLAEPIAGRVARIAPAAQAGSRSVAAWIALDGHPALRQGLFARAEVERERRSALLVPASALRSEGARPTVWVAAGGAARSRAVTPGATGEAVFDDDTRPEAAVEVTSGLAEGEVVLRGSVGSLREGTALRLPASRPASASSSASASASEPPSAASAVTAGATPSPAAAR